MKTHEYKQEFFDREYSAKEAYGRLWEFARKYRARIFFGLVCGILTASTLLPFFNVIQPALDKVGGTAQQVERAEKKPADGGADAAAEKARDEGRADAVSNCSRYSGSRASSSARP